MDEKQRKAVALLINFFKFEDKAFFLLEQIKLKKSLTKKQAHDIWFQDTGKFATPNYFAEPFDFFEEQDFLSKEPSVDNVRSFRYWGNKKLKRFSDILSRFVDELASLWEEENDG